MKYKVEIRRLAELLAVKTHTLISWGDKELFPRPETDEYGRMFYDLDAISKLFNVSLKRPLLTQKQVSYILDIPYMRLANYRTRVTMYVPKSHKILTRVRYYYKDILKFLTKEYNDTIAKYNKSIFRLNNIMEEK